MNDLAKHTAKRFKVLPILERIEENLLEIKDVVGINFDYSRILNSKQLLIGVKWELPWSVEDDTASSNLNLVRAAVLQSASATLSKKYGLDRADVKSFERSKYTGTFEFAIKYDDIITCQEILV